MTVKKQQEQPLQKEDDGGLRFSLDTRIPLVLVMTILIQTGGMVWWAATISARVDTMYQYLAAEPAYRERFITTETKVLENSAKILDLNDRVKDLERK